MNGKSAELQQQLKRHTPTQQPDTRVFHLFYKTSEAKVGVGRSGGETDGTMSTQNGASARRFRKQPANHQSAGKPGNNSSERQCILMSYLAEDLLLVSLSVNL